MNDKDRKILESIKAGLEKHMEKYDINSANESSKVIVDETVIIDEVTEDGVFYEVRIETPTIKATSDTTQALIYCYKHISIFRYRNMETAYKQFEELSHKCDPTYRIVMEKAYRCSRVVFDIDLK